MYRLRDGFAREAAIKRFAVFYRSEVFTCRFRCVAPTDRVHEARREIEAMKACEGHPHCVQLLGYTTVRKGDVTEFLIGTEFCAGGTLFDAVQKGSISSEGDIISAFAEVCSAVGYMHSLSPPMMHRDLKVNLNQSHFFFVLMILFL